VRTVPIFLCTFFLVVGFGCQQDPGIRHQDEAISVRSDGEQLESEDTDESEVAQETELNPNDLPQLIRDAAEARYPGAKLLEADKLAWVDGSITYDVEILLDGETIEPMFVASGEFLGEEDQDESSEKY